MSGAPAGRQPRRAGGSRLAGAGTLRALASCVFCGRSPTTRAHIFRKGWIDRLFPGTRRFTHRHVRHEATPFDATWSRPSADFKVKSACTACNSGWMNDLDHAAEELFVTHAATGYPARLDRMADKATVARWCSLVSVLFDQAQARPRLGRGEHQAVYGGQVPEGAAIWLAATEPPAANEPIGYAHAKDWHHESRTEAGARDQDHGGDAEVGGVAGFFLTFGIGQLLAQTFLPLTTVPEAIVTHRFADWSRLRQLWPDTLMPLVWPPPAVLPRREVEAFARTFRYVESQPLP